MLALLSLAVLLPGAVAVETPAEEALAVYIGTYTGKGSRGIYRTTLDPANGRLSPAVLAGETINPSFLAIHPNGRNLYAVNEIGDFQGKPGGAVSAFAIDGPSGHLALLNQQPSGGGGPCHLVLDKSGRAVLLANYGGGSVESLPIAADGTLGAPASVHQHVGKSIDPARQTAPHAHSINLDAANRFAVAADLGLDRLFVYRFDPRDARLTPHEPAFTAVTPGSGPRHFAFHPDGMHAYVINEMALTVTAFLYNPEQGVLNEIQTVTTLPEGADRQGASTAEIQVHPSGKFLYGSNRGHNSLAIFTIEPTTGRITAAGHVPTGGRTPRNFAIDPSGRYLLAANQDSNTIVTFRIDAQSGGLSQLPAEIDAPNPVCLKFLPAAR